MRINVPHSIIVFWVFIIVFCVLFQMSALRQVCVASVPVPAEQPVLHPGLHGVDVPAVPAALGRSGPLLADRGDAVPLAPQYGGHAQLHGRI